MGGIGSREDIWIENAADPFDNLQLQMNREVVIRKLDSDSALLRQINAPIGISEYRLAEALPASLEGILPTVEELEAELAKDDRSD